MIDPATFIIYCVGVSVVVLSAGVALRVARQARPNAGPEPQRDEAQSNADMGFAKRLKEFQEARFASPIVKRQLVRAPHTARNVPRPKNVRRPGVVVKLPTKLKPGRDGNDSE